MRPVGQGQSKKAKRRRAARAANGVMMPRASGKTRLGKARFPPSARSMGNAASSALVTAPAAVGRVRRQQAPQMQMAGNGQSCVIRHREYIAELPGSTAFAVTTYVCQPALQAMFNWLGTMAGNWEKYRFRKLRFVYETESGSTQTGAVVLVFDPDVLDAAPASKQAALSYKFFTRSPAWQECALDIAVGELQRDWMYTRPGSVPSGADQKLYDVGNLHACVQGSSGATGELYVEYIVELISPQQAVSSTNPISGKSTGTTSLTATALVGADAAYTSGSNVGWALTSASTFTCTIAGSYLFVEKGVGTVIVTTGLANSGTATLGATFGVTNTAQTDMVNFCVVTAQVGQTFIPTIISATTVTSSVFRISLYQASLN